MPFLVSTSAIRVAALASLLVLSACGDDASGDDRQDAGQAGTGLPPELPSPEGAIGSVTGMPAHPGPGTSPIEPVQIESVQSAATPDPAESASLQPAPLPAPPPPEATLADAPPLIIVPDLPPADVAPVEPARPPDAPRPRTRPIGTEGATESTTIIVEPEPDD